MSEFEKEKIYKEALGYLESTLSNDETLKESIELLTSLGDYKDSRELYEKYLAEYNERMAEKERLKKRRRFMVALQITLAACGLAIALALVLITVYGLRPNF